MQSRSSSFSRSFDRSSWLQRRPGPTFSSLPTWHASCSGIPRPSQLSLKTWTLLPPTVYDKLGSAVLSARTGCALYYVTTGKCSAPLVQAAQQHVKKETGHPSFFLFDGRRIINILDDYLDGVAPPIPWVELPVDVTQGSSAGIVWRFDQTAQIESWVFVANGHDIGQLFHRAGVRIFARNVRGYLGLTDINRAITNTLASEPEHFLYFNNGVTIVCDDAEKVEAKGRSVIRIDNPQIINGQQTTRALAVDLKASSKARVLVRVIRIPRNSDDADDGFEQLVSQIVEATNWQNQIKASDLMSNDRRQIAIERELRKRGYQYLRKRQTKREAHLAAGTRARLIVKKEELALAVAACELDPVVARSGKERLFEERYYKTIFPGEDANYYLIRYWLWKRVSFHARGSSERAYSRWVAIHFLWSEAGFDLRKNSRAFIKACESPRAQGHVAVIREFDRMIERSILAAIKFFRNEHGKHGNPVDVSGFFNRQGRHREIREVLGQRRESPRIDL